MLRASFAAALGVLALLAAGVATAEALSFPWGIGPAPLRAAAAAPQSYAQAVLADAPAAYFRLDDAGTVAVDATGHGHNGSIPGGAPRIAGALVGDASGALQVSEADPLSAPSGGLPALDASQTVEAWVRLDPALRDGVARALLGLNGVQLRYYGIGDGDTLVLHQPHGGVAAVASWDVRESPSLADGGWHQVAYTFDAGTGAVRLYVDGAPVAGSAVSGGLGGDAGLPLSTGFTGGVDELAVYPTALSPARFAAHFTAALRPDQACASAPTSGYALAVLVDRPARYLPLNEPAGSRIAFDASGNCGNGGRAAGTGSAAGVLAGDSSLVSNGTYGVRLGTAGLPALDASQTVEAWVRVDPALRDGVARALIGLNGVQLRYVGQADSDTLLFHQPHGGVAVVGSWDVRESPSLADGGWHQLAYTFDAGSGTVSLFVDGIAVGGNSWSGGLGGDPDTPLSTGFVSGVDELAVYPAALSRARIAAHYVAAYAGDAGAGNARLLIHLGAEGAGLKVSAIGKGGRVWQTTAHAAGDALLSGLDLGSTVTVSVSGADGWKTMPVAPAQVALTEAVTERDLTVIARPSTTLTGRATVAGDGTPVEGAQVAVVQSTGGQSGTLYGTTDAQGMYTVPGLRGGDGIATTASFVSSRGYAPAATLDLDATQTHDFSVIPVRTYRLQLRLFTQLPGQPAQEQPDTAITRAHFPAYVRIGAGPEYRFPATDIELPGHVGEEVSYCAQGAEAGLELGCVTATLPASAADPVALSLTLRGAQQVSVVAQREDGNASFVQVTGVKTGDAEKPLSVSIPTGIAASGDPHLLAVPEAGTWDFTFTSGTFKATRTGVVVAADEVTPLGTVQLGDSGVFGSADNAALAAPRQVAPGGLLDVTAKWHAASAAANATLHLDVPPGTTLPANGFVVNGAVVPAGSAGTVSAPLGNLAAGAKGTATLHLRLGSALPAGTLPIRARISYDGGQGLVGTAVTDVAGVSLDGPSQTAVGVVAVRGHAPPGSEVTIREGELLVGRVTTPASGYWRATVTLPDRGQRYVHSLVATTDAYRSNELAVRYDRFIPTLGAVTLSQDVAGGSTVTTPPGASFPYVVLPYQPLQVRTRITQPERVTNASIELDGQSFKATVGADGTLQATTAGYNGYPTGAITLNYDLGRSMASFIDQAGPPPESLEQARLRLPAGLRSSIGDPVADPENTPTDLTFTSTIGGDPGRTVTTSVQIDDTPPAAVGQQRAGGLWLGPEGVSQTEDPDTGELRYSIRLIVDEAAARGRARTARSPAALKQLILKFGSKGAEGADHVLAGTSWYFQAQEINRAQQRASRCIPPTAYDAALNGLRKQLEANLTAAGIGLLVAVPLGPLGAGVVAAYDEAIGNVLDDKLNNDIAAVERAIANDPRCDPQPPPPEPPCPLVSLSKSMPSALARTTADGPSCRPRQEPIIDPRWIYDPSGTITDGPYSSPLKDATVTIVRSDSGNPGTWEVWNADDYAQTNPMPSAGSGAYGWNVPPGFYRVGADAPGHLPAQSEALEVLPPRTGVDLMLPVAALGSVADVAGAGGTAPSVTVRFATWMQADSLDAQHLTLTDAGGNPVPATVTAVDPQPAPTGPALTKTVRLVPTPPSGAGATWSPTLTLHVAASVKDAAGRPLAAAIDRAVALVVPAVEPPGGNDGPPVGGGGPPVGGGGPPPQTVVTSAQVQKLLNAALSVTGSKARIPQLLSRGGFSSALPAPGAGTLTITWTSKRPKAKVVVAKVTVNFKRAGKVNVKVALTAGGKKLLKKSSKLRLTATATFRPKDGVAQSKSKTLVLKRR